MNKKEEAAKLGRRDFIRGAGLGVGAAGAAAVVLPAASAAAAETDESAQQGAGYQETAHVKTYYQLARF